MYLKCIQKLIICLFTLILVVSILPQTYAFEELYTSSELIIQQRISSSFTITNPQNLDWIQSTVSFVPQNSYRQTVIDEFITPQPFSRNTGEIVFRWFSPRAEESFSYTTVVKTKNVFQPVTSLVPFPITNSIPEDVRKYLQTTTLIDINDPIRDKARELAQGSDDLFVVAHTIANWVTTNIKYDLTTLTEDASQPASWVFENRYGVCDELSTLYIAMMRSLGIPARFVSGMSFSNSDLFDNPWNAHAWAEVYFFEHGWVPFDLTYRQFGYIDATHITLKTSVDAEEASTSYLWSGRLSNVEVTLAPLDFEMTILEIGEPIEQFIQVTPSFVRNDVGFGSYNALQLEVQNMRGHYMTGFFDIAAPVEIKFEDNLQIPVLLRPFESTLIFIPFQVPSDLSQSFVLYTFPFAVYNYYVQAGDTIELKSRHDFVSYSQNEIIEIMDNRLAAIEPVDIACDVKPLHIYVGDTVTIQCQTNTANEICIFDECQTSGFEFSRIFSQRGDVDVAIRVDGLVSLLSIFVNDIAQLSVTVPITEFTIPRGDSQTFSMLLEKTSFNQPENIQITIGEKRPTVYDLGNLVATQNVTFTLSSSLFLNEVQMVPIIITYDDSRGNSYEIQKEIHVTITGLSTWNKFVLWVRRLFH